jgi:hypothetical protein
MEVSSQNRFDLWVIGKEVGNERLIRVSLNSSLADIVRTSLHRHSRDGPRIAPKNRL